MRKLLPLSRRRAILLLTTALGVSASVLAMRLAPERKLAVMKENTVTARLVPDKPTVMVGEPLKLSFIVENHTKRPQWLEIGGDYRNDYGRPNTIKLTIVRGSNGERIPTLSPGFEMGGTMQQKKLHAGEKHDFRLALEHWVKLTEPGSYTITARRKLVPSGHLYLDKGTSTYKSPWVEASTKLTVLPTDNQKLGEVIAKLGNTMLHGSYDKAEEAARTLEFVSDERVVPYFARRLETGDYTLCFVALAALRKFGSEEAFQALKRGMRFQDKNLRHVAASSLAQCPHPGAIPYLITYRHDPSIGVRNTIAILLGKGTVPNSIALLKTMLDEPEKAQRDDIKNFIKELSKRKPK